jgi:DNA-binding NarL/FixJ family response regulator
VPLRHLHRIQSSLGEPTAGNRCLVGDQHQEKPGRLQSRERRPHAGDESHVRGVEDHPVVREGLATMIGSQPDMVMVAQAANAEEAIVEFRRHRPDITLMDLRLPGTNGTDTLIAIQGEFPGARIIMLSMSEGDGEIQRALRSGASAYLLKSMPKDALLAGIRAVHAGRKHVPAEVAARLVARWEELETRREAAKA